MDNDLLETIFEAITTGDETNLRRSLGQATIETVLQFQRAYGESPLHLCVKIGGMSHLGAVRCLLASRLFDSTAVDGEGLTALECALKNGDDGELGEALIKADIDGLDDATACYRMLRYDSLEIFQKYLHLRQYTEEDEFQSIASALIRLNVANVKLSEALHHYTQWKLSDYGFRALSGNWTGTKDANEWKTHIDIIGDCWRVIRERHDTRLYDDADDMFLHRLQTVHNHFYLLKHKQFLAHLPMQEVTFCVAIFLAIFRNPTQFADYRLTVNKCMVIEFVRMVSEQLAIVRKYLEGTERELLAIAHRAEAAGAEAKDRLIGELLAKLESSPLPNKAHVMKQLKERAATDASNKDSLMKDMLDKVKRIDKRWAEKKAEELKALDRGHRERLIEQLGNRLRHVSHPQNVVNRLLGDWKKGKPTDTIVADIVAGESFDLCHLLRGKDRRRMRKLLKCYRITKQHYSLHKIVFYCKNIESIPQPDVFRPATHVDIACMKRTIQVLGEAIKNTTNSANMPARAEDAVNSMLTALFPNINKLLREVFSHSISLKKLLQGESSYDRKMCTTFHAHMGMMRTAFQLLYVVTVADVRQAFYGQLRRCETFREMRSLVLYAGDSGDLEDRQHACYRQVTEYFEEAKAAFERVEKESIGKTALLQHLRQHLDVKREIVKELGRHFKENDGLSETEVRRACLSGDDLPSVRRLLDWKLTMNWAGSFYRKVRTSWATNHVESLTLEWMDPGLVKYNPAVIAGMLKMASSAMECSEEFEYIGYTRQLAVELNVAEGLDEEALRQLNKRLRSYYGDIFFVDNKWKVLEAFCRERKLPWNREQARLLVKRDQEVLQQLYNGRRRKLRTILEQHRLHTVEGLVTRLYTLPTRVMSSIEYLQLELCEMLLAVGYFGDNFHYLKRRIPMIQGKNYRNYLAHDQLSYNLLTDCWMEKIVINAFVFANTEVRLFGSNSHASNASQLNVPTVSEMDRWVERQQQLLAAFQARDIARMHTIAQDGGELKARFCCSQNTTHHPATYCLLPELINPCRFDKPTVQYLDLFFAGFEDQCNNPAYQLKMALTLHDFQAIFDRTIALGNTHIPEELLDWEDLMPRVRQTKLFLHLVAAYNRAPILSKLIEHGNVRGVRELLPYFETFNSPNDRGPLGDALLYCSRSIVELLLPRSMAPHPAILLLAIILHRNDVFTHMMAKLAHIDAKTFHDLLRTTAQARNYTATVYLMENEDFRPFHADALVYSCKLAARMGERAVLQHLFERCPTPDGPTLAKTLHQAAVKNRWQCVELLLQHNAPVDVVFADNLSEENCTLLVLVKYGACRLLRKIQSVQHAPFGTIVTHPLDVAVRHGTDSKRMIRTLRTLGFDWLDSSAALHAAIRNGRTDVFETIRKLVDEQCAMVTGATVVLDHFRQALGVLQRWKMISFVEESKKAYGSSLFCAVQSKDQAMVRELLSWGRRMRTLDGGVGFLGGIAFERESTFTRFGKKANSFRLWNTRDCCEEMIVRMETCAGLGEMMIWQRFTADAPWTTVTFHVLTACDEVVEASLDKLPMPLRDSDSLVENLEDFLAFANSSLSNYDIVFAEFSTKTGATRCFWQIEQISCMYDIVPSLANGAVDLTDTINYRDVRGETALHHCFPNDTLELVKLLVENGAHPLLADNSDMAPIHLSMLNSQDFAVARYLFDECIRRDLRNEKGCSVLDLDDGSGANSLLHTVAMTGRVDILQRLLEHRVDVSKVNAYGVTAAQLAVSVITYNAFPIVRMLLDYDASSINATDRRGFTLLRCAVQEDSAQLTQLVLQYAPDLFANRCGMTPLAYAVAVKHTECAKCILRYATENNIRGVTQADEDCDLVLLSLMTNDYELPKMLLEYELERTLEEVDERDLPRIRSILEGTIPERPGVPVAQLVQRYDESQKLLQELLLIVTSVTVPSG